MVNYLVLQPRVEALDYVCMVMEGPIMERFDFSHYPLCFMLQDALIILTPVLLILVGILFWPSY